MDFTTFATTINLAISFTFTSKVTTISATAFPVAVTKIVAAAVANLIIVSAGLRLIPSPFCLSLTTHESK